MTDTHDPDTRDQPGVQHLPWQCRLQGHGWKPRPYWGSWMRDPCPRCDDRWPPYPGESLTPAQQLALRVLDLAALTVATVITGLALLTLFWAAIAEYGPIWATILGGYVAAILWLLRRGR